MKQRNLPSNPRKYSFIFTVLPALALIQCLELKPSATADLPVLLSLLNGPQTFYLFPDESDAGGESLGMIEAQPGPDSMNTEWVPFSAGPANTWKAEVLDATIFVLSQDSEDELWISRDRGQNWEIFEAPDDNESEDISHILGCGNALILTYDTISVDEEDGHPGYVSYDNGRTFQSWSAAGADEITIDGIDCNESYLYIASADQNHLQWAPIRNLNSFSTASSHSSFYDQYYGLVAGAQGLVGMADQNGDYYSNYSTGLPEDMQNAGSYPVSYTFHPLGADRHAGADYIQGRYHIGMLDTFDDLCRIYSFKSPSSNPSAASFAAPGCEQVTEIGNIPALAGIDSRILFSYRNASGNNGSMLISENGGQSYKLLNISEVWNDAGFIADIEVD